jgi:hypothetical protein
MPVDDLRRSPMMSRLLDALERGEDIGHYGRLTFAIVARYFVDQDQLLELLTQGGHMQPGSPHVALPLAASCGSALNPQPVAGAVHLGSHLGR